MSNFTTLHIFKFGTIQLIKDEQNFSVNSADLSSLNTFINAIKNLKPKDVILTDYHSINIFNEHRIDYNGVQTQNISDKTSFLIKWVDIPLDSLNILISEIETKIFVQTPIQ
jgi:hypothetical protein